MEFSCDPSPLTPTLSSGYVFNGLTHLGSRRHAVGGAIVCGSIAGALHTVLPHFHLARDATRALLAFDLLEDPSGSIRAAVDAPPVLPPFSWAATRAAFERFALQWLPVRTVSDEEWQRLESTNPPLRLSFRK